MPRTVEEIVAQADELARKFETGEVPGSNARRLDGAPLRAVREAFEDAARAQKRLAERVSVARAVGHSWGSIGMMLGTSGEAARQRYGQAAAASPTKSATAKTRAVKATAKVSRTAKAAS